MNTTETLEQDEFEIDLGDRRFAVAMLSPPAARLANEPALLLSFAGQRQESLSSPPYSHTANAFLTAGHRVVSFDLTGHGERIDHFGVGITAWRNGLVLGAG